MADTHFILSKTVWHGVIPGGQSFVIPVGSLTDVAFEGTGFNWTPSVRGGTTLLLVGGDDNGLGSAGSGSYNVGFGVNPDNSCLNNTSPSSTPGTPAGGSYPTSPSNPGTNNGGYVIHQIFSPITNHITQWQQHWRNCRWRSGWRCWASRIATCRFLRLSPKTSRQE
jgi:hypothetical protein